MYRGGTEQKIRKYLVDNNFIDCIIQLPANLFFGTNIATCIMVMKRGKKDNRTLFIAASKECVKVTNNNRLTTDNIQRIVDTFASREEEPHFSHLATYDEIAANDYNLSVSTYVELADKRDVYDVYTINRSLEEIIIRDQDLRMTIQNTIEHIEQFLQRVSLCNVRKANLDDICEMVTVGIANSATQAYSDSGVIMFRNQNIKENYLDDTDLIYINEEFESKYKSKRLKKDDILITRTGYPGIACLVPEKYSGAQTFTTLIARLKNCKLTIPGYVCYYINSGLGKSYVNSMKKGAAQQNFGSKSLEKMPITLPDVDIQLKIVAILDKLNSVYSTMLDDFSAESCLRKKQFEFYKDKLLTFVN
jgi:hypothetical protein